MADQYSRDQLITGLRRAADDGNIKAANEIAALLKSMDAPATPPRQTDVVEQGMSGVYEGLASGFGAPVDLLTKGINAVGGQFGMAPITDPFGGSESIERGLNAISGVVGGQAVSDVQPQTGWQRVARSAGQGVGATIPAAAALPALGSLAPMAGGNAVQQLARGAYEAYKAAPQAYAAADLAMGAGSGFGGGVAKEVFPGSPTAELAGQIAGAVTGGGLLRAVERAALPPIKAPQSATEMAQRASDIYDGIRQSGFQAAPAEIAPIRDSAINIAKQNGLILPNGRIDQNYPHVATLINKLGQYARAGMTAPEILATRQSITNAMKSASPGEATLMRKMLASFDANTSALTPDIAEANAMWAKAAKANTIETMLGVSGLRAGKFSQSGLENAIRTEFRNLAIKIEKGQEYGWTQSEVGQINKIANGGDLENALRFIGRFAPKGIVSMSASSIPATAALYLTKDPYVAGAVGGATMAAGLGGNALAGRLQQGNAQQLYENILGGRNLSPQGQERMRAAVMAYLTGLGASKTSQQ